MDAAVSVRNLTKRFTGVTALSEVSFDVPRGALFGLLGPNGAGKTTTLKILMGLIRPSGGEASILGHGVGESEFRKHVGFLPENPW